MKQVEIFDSSFLSEIHSWKMPKSDLYYPIVKLSRNCIDEEFKEHDKIRFELFFKEVYENYIDSNKLILDVSKVQYKNSLENLLRDISNPYLDALLIVGSSGHINIDEQQITSIESIEQGMLMILDSDKKKRFDGGAKLRADSDQIQISVTPSSLPCFEAIEISMFIREENGKTIGYVKLEGDLEEGSISGEDAKLANRRTNQFDKLYQTDFLILDFTDLKYSWGDDFSLYPNRYTYVNLSEEEYESLHLVIRENQILEGYKSVLHENENRVYQTYDDAMNHIRSRIQSE